jgi:ATP-dependent DNA ligase
MRFEPMLARAGGLQRGDHAYEVKWDGFRAIISTEDGLRVCEVAGSLRRRQAAII